MTRQGIFASVVAVAPVLLFSVLNLIVFASDEARLQTNLERGLERVRPCEGRWTGLGYSPLDKGRLKELSRLPNFRRKISEILRRAETTSEWIRDRALIAMIADDREGAVRILEAGIEVYPADAALYNNLAVVHFAEAEKNEPHQLILALSASHRSVALDGSLPEAVFNHALILERLHLYEQSRLAWRRYLDLDGASEWAGEARAHLYYLERPIEDPVELATAAIEAGKLQQAGEMISRSTQSVRFHVENELLPEWARAIEQSDHQSAEKFLGLAESFSSMLLERSGDHLLADTIGFIRHAEGETPLALAAGHRLYGEGAKLFGEGRFGDAKARFLSAQHHLEKEGSPFGLWAQFNAALCDYQQGKVELALNSALKLREQAESLKALNLMGRIDWMTGLMRLEEADPTSGLGHLRHALEIFQRTGEKSYEGAVASIIANTFAYLGDLDEAWSYHFLAVASTTRSGDASRISAAYGSLARSLMKKGEPRAALYVQNEAVKLNIQDNPVRSSEAFWWRSMILRELGKPELALRDLEQARLRCETIPEEATRNRNMAGLLVTEGSIRAVLDPQSAVEMLTRALDLYRESKYTYLVVDIYLERARALLRLKQAEAAEADFLAAIEEYERQRGRVEGARKRISFFSRADDVFSEMVAFQVDRGNWEKAFEFSERSRARESLDSSKCSGSAPCAARPLSLEEVLDQLPSRTTLVQFHVLGDRLLIWSLREGKSSLSQRKIGRSELAALIDRFVTSLQRPGHAEDEEDASKRLYQLLIEPISLDFSESDQLVLVPDGLLDRVPFNALREPRTGDFLIEKLPVAIEPSSSLYAVTLQSARQRLPGQLTSLAIGNPLFDRAKNPFQADLPGAEREARGLALRAPGSVLLSRKDATIENFLHEIHKHGIIHFGGHALVDRSIPGGSRLLFAQSSRRNGELYGEQIQGLRLDGSSLVVLSACSTGSGGSKALEGTSDLARPFLEAGVPAVVVSLWPVEDRQSEIFWKLYYDSYFAGHDAGAALQSAQAAMMGSNDKSLRSIRAWAGYRLVGVH
jgi:CHAT domain-containing protein